MPRENHVPESPREKALAYLRGELPKGYRGAAEKAIRDALGVNGSVLKFNRGDGIIEIYKTPESVPDVVDFETAGAAVERYFERLNRGR